MEKIVYTLEECRKLEAEGYVIFAVTDWVYSPENSKAYHLRKPENI